jgi:hypothetical protein
MIVGFTAFLIMLFVPPQKLKKSTVYGLAIFAFLFSTSKLKKAYFLDSNHNFTPVCVRDTSDLEQRNSRLNEALNIIKQDAKDKTLHVLGSGNVLANLVGEVPRLEPIQFGASPAVNITHYDWLMVEYGAYGHEPLVRPEGDWVQRLREIAASQNAQIIKDGNGLLLIKGPFAVSSLKEYSTTEIGNKPKPYPPKAL